MFRYGSLFRGTDCGFLEGDRDNISRYRVGIFNYTKKFIDDKDKQHNMDFSNLESYYGVNLLHLVMPVMTGLVVGRLAGKYSYMAGLAFLGSSFLSY